MSLRAATLTLIWVAGICSPAEARQREPLPDFTVIAVDGTEVRSDGEALTTGRRLIVYIRGACKPCDVLLNLVNEEPDPLVVSALSIIVGGGAEQIAGLQAKFPALRLSHWYGDSSLSAWKALQMRGAPTLLGLNQGVIEWRWSGATPGGDEMKNMLSDWVTLPKPGGGGRR